jgi:hypothetical protein
LVLGSPLERKGEKELGPTFHIYLLLDTTIGNIMKTEPENIYLESLRNQRIGVNLRTSSAQDKLAAP